MATDRSNDARAFREFLDEKLSQGAANLTLDQALGLWAIETQCATDRGERIHTLRDALALMQAEDTGIPSCQFRADVSRKYDRAGRPRVPASSSVSAEVLGALRSSCSVLHGSRWLD